MAPLLHRKIHRHLGERVYFVAWVVWGGVELPEGVDLRVVKGMVAAAGAGQASGGLDLPLEGTLNGVFPQLGTLKVEEAVRVWVSREMSRSV